MTQFFEKSKSPYSSAKMRYLAEENPQNWGENSKIVIERITLEGMLNLAEDNDWPPRGLKVPPRGCLTHGKVQAMSLGGITNFGQESFLKVEISQGPRKCSSLLTSPPEDAAFPRSCDLPQQ